SGTNLTSFQVKSNGTLAFLANNPVGTTPRPPTIDPLNRFLFVPNSVSNNVSVFTFNSSTGALAPVAGSPFPTLGTSPDAVTVDPQGRFLWVNNTGSGNVSMYFIAQGAPFLTPAPGNPLATGPIPQRVVFAHVPNT